ncbi:MAG: hypothetical protein HY006_01865 [Candidatus Sungbacteria bacterium]|nr:hypothetical protein [Candidatus Sungbacteria bacterium]
MAITIFVATSSNVFADHLTPERIVADKYTVILLLIPEGEEMRMRFIFREMQTGKPIPPPIRYQFSIRKENTAEPIVEGGEEEAKSGVGEFVHLFPEGGLYKVTLTFEVAREPGMVYRPDHWSVWVPGVKNSFYDRYPIGFTEIAGLATLLGAFSVVVASVLYRRISGKSPSLNLFGIFGTDEDIQRRKFVIKKEREKNKTVCCRHM